MINYIEIIKIIASNKEIKKFGLVISLGICLLMIGRLSVKDPVRSDFCHKEILDADNLKKKNALLESSILDLEEQISRIQKDRYKKEVEIIDSERKECNIKIAKKIKSVKKLYLEAKCKICNK